ncbi:MAG: cytochrome P450 [Hyphomicrobiaceae bacterium]
MGSVDREALRAKAYATPLSAFDVADPGLFEHDACWPYFERLRREEPVHFCPESRFGSYWSVTRYHDIMHVDTHHRIFSSEAKLGGPTLIDGRESFRRDRFMAMDPPKHTVQRKSVMPVVSPGSLAGMEPIIRKRVGDILDDLPRGKELDWVDRVSIEITTQTLAMLFEFPWEERRKLTRWSNVSMAIPESGIVADEASREAEMLECYAYFKALWDERIKEPPRNNFISMMAHSPEMRDMPPMEYLGNVILLIVGGNDTTRNSMSAGVYALNKFPAEYAKLKAAPGLIPNMVSEIIRWQTPLAHMRRTAVVDCELAGRTIRKGDRVVMWYISGNRDETVIANADALVIDRDNARQHLSFGFGIHRCLGNRLAELQLRILWEEITRRGLTVTVTGEPKRTHSNFVHGYETLPVIVS